MGNIFYLFGKSSTGKDTIYKNLMENPELKLRPVIPYTTRPLGAGEIHGVWKYFTADGKHIDLDRCHYIMIGVLDSFLAIRKYYGKDRVIPIYIEVEDGERLQRALDRERSQEKPRYAELCRRFLTDSRDFAEEKIMDAGIERRFVNRNLQECIQEITVYIQKFI